MGTGGMLPTLTVGELELRPAVPADAEAVFAFEQRALAVPEARRFLLRAPPASVDEVRARIERSSASFSVDHSVFQWLIRLSDRDSVVGFVAFVRWNHEHHRSEVAWVIEPAHWGKGFAALATAQILQLAWTELGLHRAETHIDPENAASIRTAQKLGFAHEGTLRENVFTGTGYADTSLFAKVRPA